MLKLHHPVKQIIIHVINALLSVYFIMHCFVTTKPVLTQFLGTPAPNETDPEVRTYNTADKLTIRKTEPCLVLLSFSASFPFSFSMLVKEVWFTG